MTRGVILYGAPAVGKSAAADALAAAGFSLFSPLKCGTGRTDGYRMVDDEEWARRRADEVDVVWSIERYSSSYLWSRRDIVATPLPVVQLGQPEAVEAMRSRVPEVAWLVVELVAPREVVAERVASRDTGDDAERMRHYDGTPRLVEADLVIDTSQETAEEVAAQIARTVRL